MRFGVSKKGFGEVVHSRVYAAVIRLEIRFLTAVFL